MKRSAFFLISSIAATVGVAIGQMAKNPPLPLPAPFATPAAENHPKVVPRPEGAELTVPTGFHVDTWAEGFERPRVLLQGLKGEILLADSGSDAAIAAVGKMFGKGSSGKIYAFPGGDPAKRKVLIEGLSRPYGMALWKNYLYVAEDGSVKRYVYDAGKLTVGPGEEVVSLKGWNNGHWTRSLTFDPKGEKFYLGVGSESNVNAGEPEMRAAISRFNPDGSGKEIFAAGTRNPTALHFYPSTEQLWAAVQERDGLGDDLVPDYFTTVKQGAFYGWPYAYSGPNEDPRRKGEKPDLVQKTIQGDVQLGSHLAVLEFTFYTGKMFPKEYQGGAFLAFHGSWNRAQRVGYEIAFLPFENGKAVGIPHDFLTGFRLAPDKKEVWGRPVAVFQLKDGSLLVTDDGGKKIWRVSYKG